MPHSRPCRLAARRTPAGLLPCRSPAPTRKKSPPAPTTPCAPEPKHQRRSDGPCRTRLLCGRYFRPWPCIDGRGARPAKTVPATPRLFSGSPAPTNAAVAFPTLTDRKREILHLIAQGHPDPSIARQVSSSTKTVGNSVSNIFTKLQVADRVQAIIRAREAGLR